MTKNTRSGGWRKDAAAVRLKRDRDGRIAKGKALVVPDGLPPHDADAERGALGCVLLSSHSQPDVDELLAQMTAALFYELRHQTILEAMKALRGDRRAVDVITLKGWLEQNKQLEGVGGLQYVAALPDASVGSFHFGHYLPILREKALRRWTARKSAELQTLAAAEAITLDDVTARLAEITDGAQAANAQTLIEVITPHEARSFEADPADFLVGEGLICRDQFITIGGEPGCGKSRLATTLAVSLARGYGQWQGYPVRSKGRTLILQTENKGTRLKEEFAAVPKDLDDSILISKNLPKGLAFHDADFRREVQRLAAKWPFQLLVLDPWNDVIADEGQSDYADALLNIERCFYGLKMPAVLIVAHLRKPRADASGRRKSGRELLHELSGSLKLGSKSRTVFAVQPATYSMDDDRIVFEVAKANDADPAWLQEHGTRSAWHRKNAAFERCAEFDWEEWMNPGSPNAEKRAVSMEMVESIFADTGRPGMKQGQLVKAIAEKFDVGESTVWRAIKEGSGYLAAKLNHAAGVVALRKGEA
jgi:DnaB-like helicase N terminal domain/AAA domain